MTAQPTLQGTSQGTPKGAWKITFLLFLFMLVNFADKIVVGLAGAPIMDELKLTPEQFGFLGSSFFFLFSISAIVVGFIVNRIDTRWVLLVMAVIWSLAQFPMVGTVSFTTLVICRIILGAGEGPAFAVAAHAVYKWFPDEKRTLPTAILSQGSAFGVILAVPAKDRPPRSRRMRSSNGSPTRSAPCRSRSCRRARRSA
jgi:predicted MFS family arabinose efflux permease